MSGVKCQRDGCGDTVTEPVHMAGKGGHAYTLYLCEKHKKELETE